MTKGNKLEEIEVKVNILTKNIKNLEKKMIDPESRKKYNYHLKKLREAMARLLEIAQAPGNSHPIK